MKRHAVGILLVFIGCVFLIDNLGWFHGISRYVFTWPNILILIGVVQLAAGKPKPALIFFLLGGFFWIDRFFYFDWSIFWPVIIIIVGIAFILRHSSSSDSSEDELDEVSILSGVSKKITSLAFKGGTVTTLFGGADLDLRESMPAEGATIDLFTMFGGTEIKIPEDWNVLMDATAILGGLSDERGEVVQSDEAPKIRIKGFVMFGGVAIKS